jgi:pimeloyl-ACP methyl ester carboxylesterase
MRLAAEGYVVLTYDPAGQGESEGAWEDLFGYSDPRPPDCEFVGACHDSQDMTRWFVGQTLSSVSDPGFRFEARKDPAANPANPLLAALDPSSIAIAGNSMGALSTLSYLDYLGDSASPGNGVGDSQLPVVKAAISLSGAAPTKAFVPLQFQTSDYDGSPALIGPTVFGIDLGNPDPSSPGEGIGYHLIKSRYNALRNGTSINEKAALSLIVLEGGVHTDHVAVPYVTRTLWSNSLASDYAADWLNCHVKGDSGACGDAIFARPHLSRAFASEQVPTASRGMTASLCIQKPDRASLNQDPQAFVSAYAGTPVYDCQ